MPILAEGSAATPLAVAADLAEYGTFTDAAVLSAGESIRGQAQWHIAPRVTETVTLYSEGSQVLLLPSLKVADVTAVRDISDDTAVALSGWTFQPNGVLRRSCGWPIGTIEVDVEHGYDSCPLDLLPVIARRVKDNQTSGAGQVRLGSLSIGTTSVGTTVTAQDEAIIARYSL